MTDDQNGTEEEGERRRWRVSEFIGLGFFLLAAAAILPLVRDSYILQDVWVAVCGAIGLN
ncbi:hypothetical protein NUH88_22200 [Nisaea acidiphila]|uniref:Uncharacterized protein n=1 Tax=Nisaea acidiphila TaxID=1862145 RepID=A0A9J7AUT8_9PROT|nr:hypothetical protein [Nisaea acidiphila]UUX50084.1 hypothetical protein NUH88_22200 [Nisaea acidiphila]